MVSQSHLKCLAFTSQNWQIAHALENEERCKICDHWYNRKNCSFPFDFPLQPMLNYVSTSLLKSSYKEPASSRIWTTEPLELSWFLQIHGTSTFLNKCHFRFCLVMSIIVSSFCPSYIKYIYFYLLNPIKSNFYIVNII